MRRSWSQIEKDMRLGWVFGEVIHEYKPKIVVETGTLRGRGSTKLIAEALLEIGNDAVFHTIEVNPEKHASARNFIQKSFPELNATLWNGLSIPRILSPTFEDVEQMLLEKPNKFPAERFFNDVNFEVEEDILGRILNVVKPDLFFLDSANHLGLVEFEYVMSFMQEEEFVLILDDVNTVKHFKTLKRVQEDLRFEILELGDRFCVAKHV